MASTKRSITFQQDPCSVDYEPATGKVAVYQTVAASEWHDGYITMTWKCPVTYTWPKNLPADSVRKRAGRLLALYCKKAARSTVKRIALIGVAKAAKKK